MHVNRSWEAQRNDCNGLNKKVFKVDSHLVCGLEAISIYYRNLQGCAMNSNVGMGKYCSEPEGSLFLWAEFYKYKSQTIFWSEFLTRYLTTSTSASSPLASLPSIALQTFKQRATIVGAASESRRCRFNDCTLSTRWAIVYRRDRHEKRWQWAIANAH